MVTRRGNKTIQSTIIMQTMSQAKNTFVPRKGQQDLIKYLPAIKSGDILSAQWPTGYGKSIGFAIAWRYCFENKIANRLLMVVANDIQRSQIVNDFAGDCKTVEAPCEGGIRVFDRSAADVREARSGKVNVFVCTVHALEASNRGGLNSIRELLETPGTKWMIGFDEFHHYGEDMPWGDAAKAYLPLSSFALAMSATPYRRGSDVVFPTPELVVTYQQAVDEKAVKKIICHSYHYAVAVIDENGDVTNYQTSDLMEESKGNIDAWEERRSIRYSPQYLHPLIINPLNRLGEKRAETGQRLQMLVRAMSCLHAKAVCDQVKVFAGHLRVDWIGTGYNGRTEDENRAVVNGFCPPKGLNGKRPDPSIDVLVQVSMAGEGFDSINVAEIVDLYPVSSKAASGKATQDKQFYGRGARFIKGTDTRLHVNVPTDHPLHIWGGHELHEWMDASGGEKPEPNPDNKQEAPVFDPFEFPDPPKDRDIELISISTESEHFKRFASSVCERRNYDVDVDIDEIKMLYQVAATAHAKDESRQMKAVSLRDYCNTAIGRLALIKAKKTEEISGAVIGRFKKEINAGIKRRFGKSRDEMVLEEIEILASNLKSQIESMREVLL